MEDLELYIIIGGLTVIGTLSYFLGKFSTPLCG